LVVACRPFISGRYWSYGPALEVAAASPTGYASWAIQAETTLGLTPGTIAANPAGDWAGNGVPNLIKYALGLSPRADSTGSLPAPVVSNGQLVLNYVRDLSKSDVNLRAEASSDLKNWYFAGQAGSLVSLSDSVESSAGSLENCRASVPIASSPVYLRLRATL
jgi:hypothetical protein